MSDRLNELKQLAISHVTHHDNGEFANLIELLMANGSSIHHAITATYIQFPITSGKPSVNALVELENFASSRYKNLTLDQIRDELNGVEGDTLTKYLAVIILMAAQEVREDATATGRA